MNATEIQTVAAVIQATAAFVFLFSVVYDARRRRGLSEQERRDAIIGALHYEWTQTALPDAADHPKTPAEIGGLFSPRQMEFFNTRLKEIGEPWTYPFRRVGQRAEWIGPLTAWLHPSR